METLTPVDLLQGLPSLLYVWSMVALGWGVIAGMMMYKLSRRAAACSRSVRRNSDNYTLALIAAVNLFLVWYLCAYTTTSNCTTWIAVVNVFYTAHLFCTSVNIVRWWNSLKRCYTQTIIKPS